VISDQVRVNGGSNSTLGSQAGVNNNKNITELAIDFRKICAEM